MNELAVWLYGIQVATLNEDFAFTWTPEARNKFGVNSRVVSHRLPIDPRTSPHPRRVETFVDGLLPEGNARTNAAINAGIESQNTFGLIARYGRDTAGALCFARRGSTSRTAWVGTNR